MSEKQTVMANEINVSAGIYSDFVCKKHTYLYHVAQILTLFNLVLVTRIIFYDNMQTQALVGNFTNTICIFYQSTPLQFLSSLHVSVLIGPSSGDVHISKL
jgi:hypothetical protein